MKQKTIKLLDSLGCIVLAVLIVFSVSGESVRRLVTPRALAAPGDGHMILFYEGVTIPSGWSCISCNPGDDFYQTFPRGNETYGSTGGSPTHIHTTTNSISGPSGSGVSQSAAGTAISGMSHTHSVNVTVGSTSNIPLYRQLKLIRSDSNAEPVTLPAGVIGLFDTTPPSGWTTYTAQNGYYPRGESTAGVIGGSNTHNHSLTISVGSATGDLQGTNNGQPQSSASAGHTHTASGNSDTVNHEPPFIEVIFAELTSAAAPPDGLISMWDDDLPNNWTSQSGSSGAFYQRFFKGSANYGLTGGSVTHNHSNTSVVTSGPSAATNSRSGSATASGSHTHTVTIADYSSESNIPPYRDVIIAKRVPQVALDQSAYRFYKNTDSYDVSTPLAGQNTATSSPPQSKPFRLRLLLGITLAELGIGNKNFKLQYAQRTGTCDTGFIGETYVDVSTNSGDIRYFDNASTADGTALTSNANDPDNSNPVIEQTYEESNNFTNISVIGISEDGLWDFSLIDFSAPASTNYCFRAVLDDGSLLNSYSVIPEIVTDDGNGHMLLLYDGATTPTGWECVSCNPAEDFYQRFFRGSDAYGATGGSVTHTHTANGSVGAANGNTSENQGGTGLAANTHTHSLSFSIEEGNNLPPYRQLKVIRALTSGVPTQLPEDSIAFFDAAVPIGWTRYNVQDGLYIRSEDTVGTTGGSLTHTNPVSGNLGASSGGQTSGRTNGSTQATALNGHTHTITGNTTSANHEPPYRETILGQLNSASSVPQNLISMWDGPPPTTWANLSEDVSQPYYQRFVKPAASYGGVGGSETHSHSTSVITSSGPVGTGNFRTGTGTSSGVHTHDITLTNISTENHLPPYIEVIFAKLGTLNTNPDAPTSLEQRRTSDSSIISVGGFSNGGQVEFRAQATDTDNPDDLQLCIEVLPIGDSFTNVATQCGSPVTYSGTAVVTTVTIAGLTNGISYHWQAQIKDGGGGVSAWVSFGGNLETDSDFSIDATAPTGTVFDGQTVGVDIDYNDGSLDTLHANWNITDAGSGLSTFEYAVGTTAGGNELVGWVSIGLVTSQTITPLTLGTSEVYYVAIRATDNAGNSVVLSSDGQLVAPSLSFTISGGTVQFSNLNAGNNYTDTQSTTLTTSTNARNGYEVRAYTTGLLESLTADTISMFTGGTYAAPDSWNGGDTGFGYTSSDTIVQGSDIFTAATCLGGGSGPCFAPYSQSAPGNVVADNQSTITGTPIVNESFTITHRVTTSPEQPPGNYQTTVIFSVSAKY